MNQNWNPRDISALVRQALQLLYDRQTGKTGNTLAGEMEADAYVSMQTIQSVVDGMAGQERVWIANGMNEMLDAGQGIGGSFSYERWMEIRAVFKAFAVWLQTPVEVIAETRDHASVSVPPVVVISRRGNPPAGWGVIPENKPQVDVTPEELP